MYYTRLIKSHKNFVFLPTKISKETPNNFQPATVVLPLNVGFESQTRRQTRRIKRNFSKTLVSKFTNLFH